MDLEHPENQFFVPMSSEKQKALEQKMRWLIRGVYAQAEKLGLQEVVWQFSGAAFLLGLLCKLRMAVEILLGVLLQAS